MTLSQSEYQTIIDDDAKSIPEDIVWQPADNPQAQTFRVDIEAEQSLFVQGWYNPFSGKLSYAIIHRGVGRIYGLDLGAEHRNPDGQFVGEKHKNHWQEGYRDKWAYAPQDITAPLNRAVEVWDQFCDEANLRHSGTMNSPSVQPELPI